MRENSQQITSYLFLTAIPFAQFCDLINTGSIALKENPNSMHKRWDKNLGERIDEDTPAEAVQNMRRGTAWSETPYILCGKHREGRGSQFI